MNKAEALITVLREHGVHVSSSGNVSCPFHDDSKPSMSLDRVKGLYNCHSCGRGGDVYSFIEEVYETDFEGAQEILEGEAMLNIRKVSNDQSDNEPEEKHLKPVNAGRIEYLEDCLLDCDSPVAYLEDRGLTPETIKHFRAGIGGPKMGRHEGRLVIPYLSPQRKPLLLRVRCIEDHMHEGHGKYESMAGDVNRMFNTNTILDNPTARSIAVCEGEIDAMTLEQDGVIAIAFPGVTNVKPHHLTILRSFDRVYLLGDNDTAGHSFNDKMQGWISQAVPIRVDGDVNEHYLKYGDGSLKDLIGGE